MNTEKISHGLSEGPLRFKDLVDLDRLRDTFERFSRATGFTTGLVSYPEQELLIGTGWRDICTQFHRAYPDSEVHCKQSNLSLTFKLKALEELNILPCKNGLVDGATPIIVEGVHLASLFTGQVLFDEPEIERFKKQAEDYGYDTEAYLDALKQVPVVDEGKFRSAMAFLCNIAVMLAEAGLREHRYRRMEDQRKRAEISLKESERKYRLLADNVTDVIWLLDMDFKFTYISPSVEKLRGYTPEEAVKVPFEKTFTPTSYQKVLRTFAREMDREGKPGVLPDRSVVMELDTIRKDGGIVPVEISASFLRAENGSPTGIIGITRDITDRKRSEKSLQESEAKLRSIFENKGTATGIYGEDSTIRDCNAVFEELVGYSRSEIIDKKKWSDFVVQEDLERLQKYHAQRLKEGAHPPSQYECKIGNKKGEIRNVIVNIGLVDKVRIVCLTDITDRKQAEAEREKLQAQLNQAQKMEAIGTLAGGVAHDFNNILSAILGYSELALYEMDSGASVRSKLEAIHRSGERARDLVRQILAFSRKEEQVRTQVTLDTVITDVLQLLRSAIPATIHIQTQISSKCTIIGDPTRVHQVIMNLGTNAYQAMLETGGILNFTLARVKMKGEAAVFAQIPEGEYAKLAVSDNGAGIPAEHMDRIFEPYFTTKEKGKGTGLGLATVHGIVKSHGGAISVESRIGKGTTFEVYLPLSSERDDHEKGSISQLPGGDECILLVDDEPDILAVEKGMLEKLGYQLKTAGNARTALKRIADHPERFDLVVTDMTMPDMTGDVLAAEIHKIRPGLPVILCTGFSELVSKEKARSLGIDGFLTKPVLLSDISKMVRKVLDEAKR